MPLTGTQHRFPALLAQFLPRLREAGTTSRYRSCIYGALSPFINNSLKIRQPFLAFWVLQKQATSWIWSQAEDAANEEAGECQMA